MHLQLLRLLHVSSCIPALYLSYTFNSSKLLLPPPTLPVTLHSPSHTNSLSHFAPTPHTLPVTHQVPGLGLRLDQTRLDLQYQDTYNHELPDAYERLLLDVVNGDKRLFIR